MVTLTDIDCAICRYAMALLTQRPEDWMGDNYPPAEALVELTRLVERMYRERYHLGLTRGLQEAVGLIADRTPLDLAVRDAVHAQVGT